MKFHRRGRPEVAHLLGQRVCTVGGRSRLLWSKTSRLANGLNDPTGCSRFGEFFLGFWSSRGCFGARVSFGIQSYVYIGPRVAFK